MERLKSVNQLLANKNGPSFSIEIIPPARGRSLDKTFRIINKLVAFNPLFIDVTSHAGQMVDSKTGQKVLRKRPGTLGLCAAIQYHFHIPTVPHMLCLGFTQEETEDALIELSYLGMKSLMALKGDNLNYEKLKARSRGSNYYASDLVKQINAFNNGNFLGNELNEKLTEFCMGVACYPEGHEGGCFTEKDLEILKLKMDLGANYAVSQMFFETKSYLKFHEKARSIGIKAPILPGIKILSTKNQLESLPKAFNISIPTDLKESILSAQTKSEVKELGIRHCVNMCQELMDKGHDHLHFYIMQNASLLKEVLLRLGWK